MTAMSDPSAPSETPRQLRLSAVALVLANSIPLAGVLLWQFFKVIIKVFDYLVFGFSYKAQAPLVSQ